MENNPCSEIYYPTRASFFAIATSRARLQRDITDFLSHKTPQIEIQACSLLLRAKDRAAELRSWFHMWSIGVTGKTDSLGSDLLDCAFRARIFDSGVWIFDRGDFRAYIGFCNAYCHANFHLLSLEPCADLVAESILIADEVCRAVEYLIQLDYLEISHVSGALETARLTLDLMGDWSGECSKRLCCQKPGGRFIDFRLWLKYLHAHKVKTGYEEPLEIQA